MKQSRNKNYFDLCIFLLLTGLRIGEAGALTLDDFDFEKRTVDISKSLQSRDLKVDDFYLDTTKTPNSERVVLMPQAAIDAVKRVIERNAAFDKHMSLNPAKSFRHCQFIFRTEYGAPITSHSFRAVLSRAEKRLKKMNVRNVTDLNGKGMLSLIVSVICKSHICKVAMLAM